MLDEGLLTAVVHGSRRSYRTSLAENCRIWLYHQYGIDSLEEWIRLNETPIELSRAEQVHLLGDSKNRQTRSFKGFLVQVCEPVEVRLAGTELILTPQKGMALFIEDIEHFIPAPEVCIVGIENGENFRHLEAQRSLFDSPKVLFVSRYPQSTDLRQWLQLIPNRYIHFGDFDLAGIHIFLNEIYAYIGERAEFFIPNDIEERLAHGNRDLYLKQLEKFKDRAVGDSRIIPLIRLIHHYGRVYEQEGYIE